MTVITASCMSYAFAQGSSSLPLCPWIIGIPIVRFLKSPSLRTVPHLVPVWNHLQHSFNASYHAHFKIQSHQPPSSSSTHHHIWEKSVSSIHRWTALIRSLYIHRLAALKRPLEAAQLSRPGRQNKQYCNRIRVYNFPDTMEREKASLQRINVEHYPAFFPIFLLAPALTVKAIKADRTKTLSRCWPEKWTARMEYR